MSFTMARRRLCFEGSIAFFAPSTLQEGDIVKCCVSERGASLLNDWLGGLLGLFFAIDELNADDDLGDEFKALESTPMLLGFQGEFKDHRQGRDP
jgi:hypothetical protein